MAEVIAGKSTNNKLIAAKDKTQVYGLAGNDTLESNGKNSVLLIGGSGNDVLNMTGGNGTLSGGKGVDTFNLTYSAAKKLSVVIEDIDSTSDKIIITNADKTTAQLNRYVSGDDIILRDDKGYFNLTLKSSSDASDYFDGEAHDYIWDILRITNQERENKGLNPLTLSQGLTDGASIRATEIEESFSHTRPDGTSCFTAVEKSYWSMGENIAAGYVSPQDVMTGWMNSTGHRENILRSYFTKLGVGYYYKSGSYYTKHWVQMFGSDLRPPDTISTAEILETEMTLNNASLSGGANSVVVKGTSGADDIYNTLGGAIIEALDGDDYISNIGSKVTLTGGDGADTIENEGSQVSISAGDGKDTITNHGSKVTIDAGAGNDSIYNDNDNVSISGGTDNNHIYNWGSNGSITAGDGKDTITNHGSKVTISAGRGNDSIVNYGGDKVTIDAGTGNDYIYNTGSNVSISGGKGNDSIYNGRSLDDGYYYPGGDNLTIDGGTGNDYIDNRGSEVLFKYTSGDGNDSIRGFNSDDTLQIGGGKGTYFSETSGDDLILTVGKGKITLIGAANLYAPNIDGVYKDPTLLTVTNKTKSPVTVGSEIKTVDASARTKAVRIIGNKLANTILGGKGNDKIFGEDGSDSISGGDGRDSLSGGAGNDKILGGSGSDSISGDAGKDIISGGSGNDILLGGSGNDSLSGDDGKDKLYGGNGNDTLTGGKGNDTLWGDAGADKFIYNFGDGKDVIFGFDSKDTLTLDGLDFTSSYKNGVVALKFADGGSISLKDSATKSYFHIDNDVYKINGSTLKKK